MYAGDLYAFGKNGKAVSIGAKKARDDSTLSPGPGAYSSKYQATREAAKQMKMSQSERFSDYGDDKPGPGMYAGDLNSFGKNGKGILIRGKQTQNYSTVGPGPGAYNGTLEVVKESTATYKMGLQERKTVFMHQEDKPGPGMYASDLNSFGKGAKAVSIRGKQNIDYSTVSPGPGAYDAKLEVIKEHQVSYMMGSSDRLVHKGGLVERGVEREGSPGPGLYNPKLPSGRSVIFDKNEKDLGQDMHPGPGYYKVPCTFADVPKYVMPNQTEEFKWV